MADEARPSEYVSITAELRLLNALVKNENIRNDARITEDTFVSETGRSSFKAIENLIDKGIPITRASFLQAGSEIDLYINKKFVDMLYDIDEEGATVIDDILLALKKEKLRQKLISNLDSLKGMLSKTDIDQSKVLEALYEMDEAVITSESNGSKLLSFNEWADKYKQDLEERKEGRKYTYGDVFLDEYLFKGAYPGAITTIAASTSMGKSTYVLSLIDNLLERNVPCMYISLEMGAIDTFDRLIAKRCGISNEELYDKSQMDRIIGMVDKEQSKLADRTNFYFCEDPNIDLSKLKALIREFKQKTHQDYVFVAIDLLTQMKNFMASSKGSSTATAMEIGMNQLNAIAKDENVHILAVVQFNRQSDSTKIHTIEEIDLLRPTLTDIKNSGAIAERSRVVMSVFRKKYYADRYLVPRGVQGADQLEDCMEIQILKNSNGKGAGKIFKYIFDADFFRLLPVADEEKSKLESLEEDF